MKRTYRLLPQPVMAWRLLAGLLTWLAAVLALAWLAGRSDGVRLEMLELVRTALAPATMKAMGITAVLWLGGWLVGSGLALALALLASRRWGSPLAVAGFALEFVALLPVWLLPWWIARESLQRRLPLPDLWQSWGIAADELGPGRFDPVAWMMLLLVALVVAGVTVGRMRHALLRARFRLIDTPPLRARGLRSAALEYHHRLAGAGPAILHTMRDALPWSLMMLVISGVILRGPGLAGWLEAGAMADQFDRGTVVVAWLWLGWFWCFLTAMGAWGERLSGGVPMVVASLQRAHGTLLGLEAGRWTVVAWAVPGAVLTGCGGWLIAAGLAPQVVWFPLAAAVLVWLGAVYLVSGRSSGWGLWLAYLARGGGHWPWWAAAMLMVWGLGLPWWQGLLLPVAGNFLEGTSRARQLASFWVRAGGVREAADVLGMPVNRFRWRSLLPALGLAMLPWMLARAALFLFGGFCLQAAVWLPAVVKLETTPNGVDGLFPGGFDAVWQWAWPVAGAAVVLRLVARLWERLRWLLASRRAVSPDSVSLRSR